MAKGKLTYSRARKLLDYNPETGVIMRRVRVSQNVRAGDVVGSPDIKGYLRVSVDGRTYKLHRVAWLLYYGKWPKGQIDHIDQDVANNRISNLRDVSAMENQHNRKIKNRNATGFCGVREVRPGRFRAQLKANGKSYYSRVCDTPQEAHNYFLELKRQHHPSWPSASARPGLSRNPRQQRTRHLGSPHTKANSRRFKENEYDRTNYHDQS